MKTALPFILLPVILTFVVPNSFVLAADTDPPVSQGVLDPTSPDGSNGWYKSPVDVTISATDLSSGVKTINWKLDSGNWSSSQFSETLNLAQNPSFETTSGNQVSNWEFSGMPSSVGSSDSTISQFGTKSVKVISFENGWNGFNNRVNYVPASPFANMTASVWLKTQGVSGTGAFFKIYALTPAGPLHLADSQVLTGTTDFIRISRSFSVSASDAYGIYIDLGLFGTGTVWYDGVEVKNTATDTQVINTYSSPGSHTLEYYSVDFSQNAESPHKTLAFKVDSTAPTNWRGFEANQQGNDHTLKAQIKVDDNTSLPDPSTSLFQYSVDGGSTWGYYSNLTSCSSTWVNDGWSDRLTTSTENSGKTLEISTNAIDFCNSNWQVCKIVRFRQDDLAGNESTKDICINGAWVQASGDVGSNFGVTFAASGSEDNTDGLILSSGSVSNFSSSKNWLIQNYPAIDVPTYSGLFNKYPTGTPLPGGKLPTISGKYKVNSSFTISSSTIPSNFVSSTFSAVVYVNGSLTVNNNLNTSPSSSILFVVSGDVLIDKDVGTLSAVFITDGEFDSSYNGNKGKQFSLYGSVAANTFSFGRSLSNNADTTPSESVLIRPRDLLNLSAIIGDSSVSWREIIQ